MIKHDRADDIKNLAEELGVEFKDIRELYSRYFAEMRIETAKMQDYMLKQEWGKLERVIHNIKGVSSSLNINDVFEKAAEFDNLLKNNETDNASVYANGLVGLIKGAEEDVGKVFSDREI